MKHIFVILIMALLIGRAVKAQTVCDLSVDYEADGKNALLNESSYLVVNLFNCAIVTNPSSTNFLYRGIGYYYLYMYPEALADFDQAILLDPESATAYSVRAFTLTLVGEYAPALADYEKLLSLLNQTVGVERQTALLQKGFVETRLGRYDTALNTYNTLIENYPPADLAYLMIGNLYYQQGNLPEAQKFWQIALHNNHYVVSSYLWDVNLYISAKNYEVAFELTHNALAINPDDDEAYYFMGYINFAMGNYTLAETYFDIAIAKNVNMIRAYYFRGLSKKMLGDMDSALMDLNFILQKLTSYEALNERGKIYQARGEITLAINDFARSIQIAPEQIDAYLELGNLFYATGDNSQSRLYYEQYVNVAGILANEAILARLQELSS